MLARRVETGASDGGQVVDIRLAAMGYVGSRRDSGTQGRPDQNSFRYPFSCGVMHALAHALVGVNQGCVRGDVSLVVVFLFVEVSDVVDAALRTSGTWGRLRPPQNSIIVSFKTLLTLYSII